jgi:prephenate dehydrogenase
VTALQGPAQAPRTLVVIGTGLIGTSVALAARAAGSSVWLADDDQQSAALAAELGAGQLLDADGPPGGRADVAVIAVPPAAVAGALAKAQQRALARCYTDVASVKELPLNQARDLGCDLASYVPGHPLAGRERSGPAAARADLFRGQPWAICPAPETDAGCTDAVRQLAAACGAQPLQLPPATHDRWVALVSHGPHLVAAAMAAACERANPGALALAGSGLRDVTRIAAGDAGLWTEILAANAGYASAVAVAVARELATAADALAGLAAGDQDGAARVAALLGRANTGVGRIPGKGGRPVPDYAIVQAVISDRPGELARLFAAAGAAGINIEDVRIEHSPGLPAGVAELSVRQEAADQLTEALAASGWPVRR